MMVGTHTLLPVCGWLLLDKLRMAAGRTRMFTGWNYCAIGLFGFLPDILSPHSSLEDRQTSLSHTVWAVMVMAAVVVPLARFLCKKSPWVPVALACWTAYVLHLAADAISGGIAWLYPWRGDTIGSYIIPSPRWIYYDAGFILLAWVVFRVLPGLKKKREVEERSSPESLSP